MRQETVIETGSFLFSDVLWLLNETQTYHRQTRQFVEIVLDVSSIGYELKPHVSYTLDQ